MDFIPRGIGGGGSLFGPSISPHDPDEIFVTCDMSQVFHFVAGAWDMPLRWDVLQGNYRTHVQYTDDLSILYSCANFVPEGNIASVIPVASIDGGKTWLGSDWADLYPALKPYAVIADTRFAGHILINNGTRLISFLPDLSGTKMSLTGNTNPNLHAYPSGSTWNPGRRIAGAYFYGSDPSASEILVGTNLDLLYFNPGTGGKVFLAVPTTVIDETGSPQNQPLSGLYEEVISFAASIDAGVSGNIILRAITVDRPVSPTDRQDGFQGPYKDPVTGSVILAQQTTRLYTMTLAPGWDPQSIQVWNREPTGNGSLWSGMPDDAHALIVVSPGHDANFYVASTKVAGSNESVSISRVHRVNGGVWTELFALDATNSNIATGWGGSSNSSGVPAIKYRPFPGQSGFVNFSAPTGLAVVKEGDTTNRLVLTDTGFIHQATDDTSASAAPTWQQMYLREDGANGSNLPGHIISATKAYEGQNLQTSVCTWLDAKPPPALGQLVELRASFNDLATIVSTSGANWSFNNEHWETPPGFDPNNKNHKLPGDVMQTVHFVDDNGIVHEFAIRYHMEVGINFPYSSVETLVGTAVDGWTGALHKYVPTPVPPPLWKYGQSDTTTAHPPRWKNIKANFGNKGPAIGWEPGGMPVWMAIDKNKRRLYVSVAHSTKGGIWYCDKEIPDITENSTWTPIPNSGPHPFNIRVLDNGDLLVSHSGHLLPSAQLPAGQFYETDTAGVWLYSEASGSWTSLDVSGALGYLKSWVQDVVVDPDDQDVWYACVWDLSIDRYDPMDSGQRKAGERPGGLFRTKGGQNWTRIFPPGAPDSPGLSVTSCAIHPTTREIFICTRFNGLYHYLNVDDLVADPSVEEQKVMEYPFRAPLRVFFVDVFSPFKKQYQVWVVSNGNGLHQVNPVTGSGISPIYLGDDISVSISSTSDPFFPQEEALRNVGATAEQLDDAHAIVDRIVAEISPGSSELDEGAEERLRARLLEEVTSKLRQLSTKRSR